MAEQIGAGKYFNFRNVQIFKYHILGVGSYGAVYRARCDQLPCAAKLLHPILVDPRERRNVDRFEQECQFLSGIRHPHIVQYLGTCRDPETGLPVLLMELMEESLTHFLEESKEQFPYHLEVNLSHDIALALAYLHSNDIIHRDLSSNNILLNTASRAKVTDFGMSKLLDAAPRTTPLTQCPGTAVYMSPEAMRIPPVYTEYLDCFSHGVLGIQIMTREFPDPGANEQLIKDPRSPVGMIKIPIPDTERRKSHIDCIDPNHPLLPIVMQCLSYNERDRPTSQELCHQLAALKEAPQYTKSMQRAQERGGWEQSSTAEVKDSRIAELQRKNVDELQEPIQENEQQLCEKDVAVVTSQQEVQQFIQDNQQLTQDTQQVRHEFRDQIEGGETQLRDNEHLEFQQTLVQKDKRIGDLEETISAREREIQEQPKPKPPPPPPPKPNPPSPPPPPKPKAPSPPPPKPKPPPPSPKPKAPSPPKPKPPSSPPPPKPKPPPVSLPQPNPREQQERSEASNTAVDTIQLNWRQCPKAPCKMTRASATVDGSMAYFSPGGRTDDSSTVYAYDSDKEVWSRTPECPQTYFTLVTVKGRLTAVGGKQSGKPTNTLLSLTGEGSERKWSELFPPMPTKRSFPAVVCSGRSLVVAGGEDYYTILSTVEVMDTESLEWFTASSLPHPLSQASATICGENLYLLGGCDQSHDSTKAVFTCSLSAFLQSCQPQSLRGRLKRFLSPTVWHKAADIPVYQSTHLHNCRQLLAVGGRDSYLNPTTAIHKYDPGKNTWTDISHMPTPRYESLVAVLPGDRLMVVGGVTATGISDVVEIAVL